MKKTLIIIVTLSLLIIITGCESNDTNNNLNKDTENNYTEYKQNTNLDGEKKAIIKGDYQTVTVNVNDQTGYEDIIIQKGIPVKLIIKATEESLNNCNDVVGIPALDVFTKLQVGESILEFTFEETGTFEYTCWMNMIINKIIVVDY